MLERRPRIATETVIGVVFSASLAIGSLLIPTEEELLEALFGDLGALKFSEALIGIAFGLIVIALILFLKEKLTLAFISADLAKTSGLNVERLNLAFLLMFAITVILGLNFLGVLLMGSLIIVPAATSRNLAKSFNADLLISSSLAIFAVALGLFLAGRLGTAIGPTIISVAAGLFFLSLLFKKQS